MNVILTTLPTNGQTAKVNEHNDDDDDDAGDLQPIPLNVSNRVMSYDCISVFS